MNTTSTQVAPFTLKGSLFTLTILQLQSADAKLFSEHLANTIAKAPKFFQYAPIVIDLNILAQQNVNVNFNELIDLLRQNQLIPVGVCGGNENQQQAAIEAGLANLANDKNAQEISVTNEDDKNQSKQQPEEDIPNGTRLITQPVRSGQQIYAKNGDLIVTASVSHGAELLADGNIHVYGPLRGRALAGINGNKQARIFCSKLEAELVSIAGLYQLNEDFASKPELTNMQIYLEKDHLQIASNNPVS